MAVGPAAVAATWHGSGSPSWLRACSSVEPRTASRTSTLEIPGKAPCRPRPPSPSRPSPLRSRRPSSTSTGPSIEPGTYRMFAGFDPTRLKIEADLTITGPNWTSGDQPVVSEGDTWAGVGVYQPDGLAGVAPCSGDWQDRDAAGTAPALARQLVRLPRSTVVQPLTPTEAFGHDAIHVRLRIDARCPPGEYYQIAHGPAGSRGVTYGHPAKDVLIDFWVVDMDGIAVVVDMWHQVDASIELVGRVTQVRDSITFVTDE